MLGDVLRHDIEVIGLYAECASRLKALDAVIELREKLQEGKRDTE